MKTPTRKSGFWIDEGTTIAASAALIAGISIGVGDQAFKGKVPWWARTIAGLGIGLGVFEFGEWVARKQQAEYFEALERQQDFACAPECESWEGQAVDPSSP